MFPCNMLPAASGTEKDNSILQDESRALQSEGNGAEWSTALKCVGRGWSSV